MVNFCLSHLRIDVHGYEFGEVGDYNDANFLQVSVNCDYCGITTSFHGPFLSAPELLDFRDQIQNLIDEEVETASLMPMGQAINIEIRKTNNLGGFLAKIELRPIPDGNAHQLELTLDQSYFPETLDGLDRILEKYPVRLGK